MRMGRQLAFALATMGFGHSAGLWPTGASAAAKIFEIGACTPQGAEQVCFGMPPAPTTIRTIKVAVPGKGAVVVMVNGSGYCQNAYTNAAEVADFETQIVDGNATPTHKGPGGLRVFNRIPKAVPNAAKRSIVPFNLASHRVFKYTASGNKVFNLRLKAIKLDPHVGCFAYSLNMTAIFNSQ